MKFAIFSLLLILVEFSYGQNTILIALKNGKKIEVAAKDLDQSMTYKKAEEASKIIGENWRLPSLEELNEMYLNQDKIGGFTKNYYWSKSEYAKVQNDCGKIWIMSFSHGYQFGYDYANYGFHKLKIRLVRDY